MSDTPELRVAEHPSLALRAFESRFPEPWGERPSPAWLAALLAPDAPAPLVGGAPLERDEELRRAVRAVLRAGGYKPTGRGKPASEYLVRAIGSGALGPIHPAVDACNATSVHSGLPISVVDLERAEAPFRVELAPAGASYVFNAGGQEIALSGLLVLRDARGPCANAVKDSLRTRIGPDTVRTLSVVWGARGYEEHLERAVAWYRELLQRLGAETLPWRTVAG